MAEIISRLCDTNGDGSGTTNANGDYSGTPDIFYIAPPAGETYDLSRIIVSMEDTAGMQAQEYGNLGAALGTGVVLRVSDNGGVTNTLTPFNITTNSQWGALCYDVDVKSWGSGNELLAARFTFAKSGIPLKLDGTKGEKFEVVLSDDLRGLISHYFLVQGIQYDND